MLEEIKLLENKLEQIMNEQLNLKIKVDPSKVTNKVTNKNSYQKKIRNEL